MLHLLAVVLPLALAAAVSPVMLTEQAVILAAPGGRRLAWRYAAGTAVVLSALVGVVVTAGQSLSLPQAPRLNASLDLAVGAALLLLALVLWRLQRERPPRAKPPRERMSPSRAFGFGAFSMATNVTSLALVVPAAKEIASSDLATASCVVAAVLLVGVVCLPAWGPVAATALAPAVAERVLTRLHDLIDQHGRTLVVLLVAAAGTFLVVRGVVRLVTG
ncbi:GAP family protein [Nocardioides aequoreus]|uniref:GAP family protein n=1 Tax=Nocardioides aequoreus TaxID=397278 RepID=UPI0004C35BFF|nr:GAP family protein [Nocardioides aequoreus]